MVNLISLADGVMYVTLTPPQRALSKAAQVDSHAHLSSFRVPRVLLQLSRSVSLFNEAASHLSNGLPLSQEKPALQNCFLPTVKLWHCRSLCTVVPIHHRRSASMVGSLRGSNPPSSCCSFLTHALFDSLGPWRKDRHDSYPTSKERPS